MGMTPPLEVTNMPKTYLLAIGLTLANCSAAFAQSLPGPGPHTPTPSPSGPPGMVPPPATTGQTIVVNPTDEECNRGWSPDLRWTQSEFEQFCTRMRTSK